MCTVCAPLMPPWCVESDDNSLHHMGLRDQTQVPGVVPSMELALCSHYKTKQNKTTHIFFRFIYSALLGTELRSSARAACVFNHWAIFLAPIATFISPPLTENELISLSFPTAVSSKQRVARLTVFGWNVQFSLKPPWLWLRSKLPSKLLFPGVKCHFLLNFSRLLCFSEV